MDAEGTRISSRRYLKVAELRAQGKSPEEIRTLRGDSFRQGQPSRHRTDGCRTYMLSKENLTPNEKGGVVHFPPHVMFYARS